MPLQDDRVMAWNTVQNSAVAAFEYRGRKLRDVDPLRIGAASRGRETMRLDPNALDRLAVHDEAETLEAAVAAVVDHDKMLDGIVGIRTRGVTGCTGGSRTIGPCLCQEGGGAKRQRGDAGPCGNAPE